VIFFDGNAMICKNANRNLGRFRDRLGNAIRRAVLILSLGRSISFSTVAAENAGITNYTARGVVEGIKQDEHRLVIKHEKIPNFMDAMTMPFNVKNPADLSKFTIGEKIRFQLHVTEEESWIDHIEPLAKTQPAPERYVPSIKSETPSAKNATAEPTEESDNPLRNFKFTNELGQPVSLSDFRSQALAITFFFTRCPIPEYCPRLTKNFEEVQHKLLGMQNAPTNWHLLSVSFDPENDTPERLKSYATSHQYDPAHWTFLTGPKDKIAELASACDVKFDPDNGLFNHNFRTLIIDPSNHLQMVFPISGDLSESIAQELLKATTGTNPTTQPATGYVNSGSKK
jgi:protein SCO1/2